MFKENLCFLIETDFLLKTDSGDPGFIFVKNLKRKYGILKDIMEMKDLFFGEKN